MLKDPQIRRFISGSLFAGAFIWVAVTQFGVEMEVVWTLFLMSFVFVGGMMVIGLVLTPLFRWMNRRGQITPLVPTNSQEAQSQEEDSQEQHPEEQQESVDEGESVDSAASVESTESAESAAGETSRPEDSTGKSA